MPQNWVEGQTAGVEFILGADGSPYVLIGGDVVTLILKTQEGHPINTDGNVTVTAAAAGKVKYTPDASDFRVQGSPYLARFRLVRGAEVSFFPDGAEDIWTVWTP